MFRLIYVSTARELMSNDALLEILTKAREKNSKLGVTGMLLYKDGNFIQMLEGDEDVVRSLYDTISHDDRHFDSIAIVEEPAQERMFSEWTMGFRNLSDPQLQSLPGFSSFNSLDLSHKEAAPDVAACIEILKFFRDSR